MCIFLPSCIPIVPCCQIISLSVHLSFHAHHSSPMLRLILPLAVLSATLLAGFWVPPSRADFPDPVIEGDTVVFRQMQSALQQAVTQYSPEKCYVHTDRTLYYPGDTLWFNAFVRNAGDLLPAERSQIVYVSLYNPQGSVLQQLKLQTLHGTAAGEFDLNRAWPGGRYQLVAHTNWMRNDSASFFRRDIVLQKAVKPRIHLKMEFERKAYGPGDEVSARFDASTLENTPVGNQSLQWTAYSEGKARGNGTAKTDANGRAYIKFRLPASLNTPDGLLEARIAHNGRSESISRPIPLVLNRVDLAFFPEGGDAIAHIPCRMAFKALNEYGKAADVEGYVADASGQRVAAFSSFHNGMGSFSFTPAADMQYTAHLTKPVVQQFKVPKAQRTGACLHLEEQNARHAIFSAGSSRAGTFYLAGTSQDKIFFFKEIHIKEKLEKIAVPIGDLPIGIARFTLLDANRTEMAERLVFLHRDRSLRIDITPNQASYAPREPVRLRLRVQDHLGRPVQGCFSMSVSDESLLTFADDKQGHLLSALLLEQDLKGTIEEPNFYFDPHEPTAPAALDYLMLTQGWRRFRWEKVLTPARQQAARFEGERTDIRGTLFKNEQGEVLPGRVLTLLPDNIHCTTDAKGFFEFKDIDWNADDSKVIVDPRGISKTVRYSDQMIILVEEQCMGHYRLTPGTQCLKGKVIDQESKAELIGVSLVMMKGGKNLKQGATTDIDGNYQLNATPGVYDVLVSYTGYKQHLLSNVRIMPNASNLVDVSMEPEALLDEVVVLAAPVSRVQKEQFQSAQPLTSEQITALPTRNVNQIVTNTSGQVNANEEEITIKGVRRNTQNYYIDGIRVLGAPSPTDELSEMTEDITAMGLSAEFSSQEEEMEAKEERLQPVFNKKKMDAARSVPNNRMQIVSGGLDPIAYFHRARQFYVPKYQRDDPAPEIRSDFRNTIYWNPAVVTDAFGEAVLDFVTSDAIANFRVTVEGLSDAGQPGRAEHKIFTEKALSLEVKTPPYVISGDTLRLDALAVGKNAHNAGGHFEAQVPAHFQLLRAENEGRSLVYRIGSPKNAGSDKVVLQWLANGRVLDRMALNIPTLERGFPVRQVFAGQKAQNTFHLHLMQPIEGSVEVALTAYPGALEEVLKSAERMLQQPGGCFEQVSSNNYPNLLVLDLLRRSRRSAPETEQRAKEYLTSGYHQLTGYECKGGGFDWWGREPAHEGLTAYGLLEFTDMKKVFPVDESLIQRTVKWLRSRRDGQGGWNINPNSLHGWQNDGVLAAYMAWAIAEAGYGKDFSAEINKAAETAWSSSDPYQMALLTNALFATGDARANRYLARLLEQQQPEGLWKGKTHSVLHADGPCFDMETTALGALALMKTTGHAAPLQRAMQYITGAKTEYGYGSTQSTVLALKALTEYVGNTDVQSGEGQLVVSVDGKRVKEIPVHAQIAKRIEVRDLGQYITHDHPRMEVFFEKGKTVLPFDLELKYASLQPLNTARCAVSLETALAQSEVEKGSTVRLSAVVRNTTEQVLASPMLVVGIPAGLTLQPWQLKKLMDEKRCDFYELWDGKAVFHFEQLPARAVRQIDLDLKADVAGVFEAPASQAFLYYQNDQRVWGKPQRVRVTAP